jgi:hypothetical protein
MAHSTKTTASAIPIHETTHTPTNNNIVFIFVPDVKGSLKGD